MPPKFDFFFRKISLHVCVVFKQAAVGTGARDEENELKMSRPSESTCCSARGTGSSSGVRKAAASVLLPWHVMGWFPAPAWWRAHREAVSFLPAWLGLAAWPWRSWKRREPVKCIVLECKGQWLLQVQEETMLCWFWTALPATNTMDLGSSVCCPHAFGPKFPLFSYSYSLVEQVQWEEGLARYIQHSLTSTYDSAWFRIWSFFPSLGPVDKSFSSDSNSCVHGSSHCQDLLLSQTCGLGTEVTPKLV